MEKVNKVINVIISYVIVLLLLFLMITGLIFLIKIAIDFWKSLMTGGILWIL